MKVINISKSVLLGVILIGFNLGLSLTATAKFKSSPRFTVLIEDQGKICMRDSLIIQYVMPNTPTGIVTQKANAIRDKSGRFTFNLPACKQAVLMIISVKADGKTRRLNDGLLVRADDNLDVRIRHRKDGYYAHFVGEGSDRYNVTLEVDSLVASFLSEKDSIRLYEPKRLAEKLNLLNVLVDKYEAKKQHMIRNSHLSEFDKKLVTFGSGDFFYYWTLTHRQFYSYNYKNDDDLKSIIGNNLRKFSEHFSYKIDTSMVEAGNYLFRLGFSEATNVLITNSGNAITLKQYYEAIKRKYTGRVREMMIANLFIGKVGWIKGIEVSQNEVDSLMVDGRKYIDLPLIQNFYDRILRFKPGTPLLHGEFLGLSGGKVMLSSLKGKVVLLDMWANGCGWCAVFHEEFHSDFYPKLKAKKDFVYLSINNGDTQQRWLTGIDSGLYTSKEYLNVSMGSLGMNHPFNIYYYIKSLPFYILIDKDGKIVGKDYPDLKKLHAKIVELLKD